MSGCVCATLTVWERSRSPPHLTSKDQKTLRTRCNRIDFLSSVFFGIAIMDRVAMPGMYRSRCLILASITLLLSCWLVTPSHALGCDEKCFTCQNTTNMCHRVNCSPFGVGSGHHPPQVARSKRPVSFATHMAARSSSAV